MHKLFARLALAAAVSVFAAGAASAAQYPPGPTGTCLDSVTIVQIQDILATCHPATGDTVFGVGGIITGFDAIPTGFGFYIQNSQGGPFTGIDVFTHGTNYKPTMGLEIGDSIVVEWSKTAEFNNGTEIFATNNNFSSPNIILRKVSSGHALPPFYVGTTTSLNTLSTNTTGEEYEGCLVQVSSATMAVARTYLQNGTGAGATTNLPFGTFYVVDSAAPSDSMLIDGATLFSYAPPAVGTPVTLVQGILEQRTSGVTSYRIQIRDGNDIVTNTPPGLSDAYNITENQIRVVYDRNVTPATATDLNNYSLGSLGSVDAAVMDGTSNVILTVSGAAAHGFETEALTVNNVVGQANGVAMTSPATRNFVYGVLSCAEMTAPDPDTLAGADCYDMSVYSGGGGRFANGAFGPRSTMTGVCVGIFGNLFYLEDAGAPLRGGITVFAPPAPLQLGRRYTLAGAAQEFISETEYAAIQYVRDDGPEALPPVLDLPVYIVSKDTCDVDQDTITGEEYESMLVRLPYVSVFQRFVPAPTNGFHVRALNPSWGDTIFIQNQNNVLGAADSLNPNYPPSGTTVSVTGVVHYQSGSFRVAPRFAADIVRHGMNVDVPKTPAALRFAVYPNPARHATLSFALPKDEQVELAVFDVSGRQVAMLAKGFMPAGEYTRNWGGRDESGHAVGAGVYFIRLMAGNVVRQSGGVILGN
jgi:hypothetical protein